MKTIVKQSTIKFFSFLIIASMFIVSCKKNDDVEPALADQVVGTYDVSSIEQSGQTINLPVNGITGEYVIAKMTDDKVNVKFAIKNNGKVEDAGEENADLKKASDGSIEFYLSDKKVGIYSGKSVHFEFNDGGDNINMKPFAIKKAFPH
jgi:hypothetical protein